MPPRRGASADDVVVGSIPPAPAPVAHRRRDRQPRCRRRRRSGDVEGATSEAVCAVGPFIVSCGSQSLEKELQWIAGRCRLRQPLPVSDSSLRQKTIDMWTTMVSDDLAISALRRRRRRRRRCQRRRRQRRQWGGRRRSGRVGQNARNAELERRLKERVPRPANEIERLKHQLRCGGGGSERRRGRGRQHKVTEI